MKKIFYSFVLLFALVKPCSAQVLEQDSLAVYDLFYINAGSIPSTPLSTWPGITVTGNRVTAIYMSFQYSNTIPSSISNLSALKKLTVTPCASMGCTWAGFAFPASFGELDSLEEINVWGVSWNYAAISMAPLFSITSLKSISLSSTYSPFGSQLGGDIPAEISNLVNLEKLYLAGNSFSFIPGAIFNCPKLEVVDFSNNFSMAGGIPQTIGNCTTLKSLNLKGNELNGTIPASIGNCTELRLLDVSGMSRQGNFNNLIGEIPASITNCHKLSTFWVNGEWYGVNPFFENITAFPELDTLVLTTSINQTPTEIPGAFSSLSHLSYLDLSRYITGSIPSALGNCPALKTLSLSSIFFSGSIPESIGNISTLKSLSISGSNITGGIPASIGDLSQLQTLIISGNNITGGIPASIGNLSQLQTLKLSCANIGGTIPASIDNLSQLQNLTLSSCSLSGPAPTLNNVPATARVDLSSNKLTFDGLESLYQHFGVRLTVTPQPNISIRYNNIRLSVNAGGTLANNTYKWYRNGALYRVVTGDSLLVTSTSGYYYADVTNSLVSGLTLKSNSFYVPVYLCPPAGNATLTSNSAGPYQWYMNDGSGFVAISNNGNFSGTTTQILQLINIPSSWTGYQFKCYDVFRIEFKLSWTGAVSNDWNYYGNWGNCGSVPDSNTDVVINAGNVVLNTNTIIRSLTIAPGASLTVSPGVTLTVLH